MSKRTRGEEGLALALASPESSPSSAALNSSRFKSPGVSGNRWLL